MKKAVYAGSFDPITFGHLDIIERSLKIADKLVVAVGNNPAKKTVFSVDERIEMIKQATKAMKNIEVKSFDELLLDFVKKENSNVIIRGLRAVSDFDYEFQMALMNRKLDDNIDTVFIMTKGDYSYLSSGLVKEMAVFGAPIEDLVPEIVEKKLKEKFGK